MSWNFYTSSGTETSQVGPQGNNGEGVPVGGSTGQIITKKSGTNYDTEWVARDSKIINNKTSAYTPVSSDAGKLITVSSSQNINITINDSLNLLPGQRIDFIQVGAGRLIFIQSGGAVLNRLNSYWGSSSYIAISLICIESNKYALSNATQGLISKAFSWGDGTYGQLGDGTTTDRSASAQITGIDWNSISAGERFSHGIRNNGQLWGWGNGGKVGDNTTTQRNSPVRIGSLTDWSYICQDSERNHTLAIQAGKLWAWGTNTFGQIGNGSSGYAVTCDPTVLQMYGTCSPIGFQYNVINIAEPTQVGSATDWTKVAAGMNHSLGIRNGQLWAWGLNATGQLGTNGSTTYGSYHFPNPVQVGSATDWMEIAAGHDYSLGIKNGGELWAWGNNLDNQLGDGTTTQRNTPVRIGSHSNWTHIAAGRNHSLGIREGMLFAWGNASNGKLGNGTTTPNVASPTQIGSATDWTNVIAARDGSLGIRDTGKLFGWGSTPFPDATNQKTTPTEVSQEIEWVDIAVCQTTSDSHALGLR